MTKILLTGATGFIGKHLSSNYRIHRIAIRNNDKNRDPKERSFYINDLNDSTDWSGAFTDIDTIVHLAGLAHSKEYTLLDYNRVNVSGTLHLASEAVKNGVKRFVFVSSIGVNGAMTTNQPFSPTDPAAPHDDYSFSKFETEKQLKEMSKKTGLELVILRPTLIYGNKAPGNFGLLTRLVSKSPLLPFGLASNQRDFISVQNFSDLLYTCAIHPKAANNIFLASDCSTISIRDFTDAIAEGLGKKIIQLPIPISIMRLAGRITGKPHIIEQLYGDLRVDSSNIFNELGWKPPYSISDSMNSLSETKK